MNAKYGRLGIRARLFIGFSLLIIPIFILTILFLFKINKIETFTKNWVEVTLPTQKLTSTLDSQIYETELETMGWLFLNDSSAKEDFNKTWQIIKSVQSEMNALATQWTNKEFLSQWQSLQGLYKLLEPVQKKLMEFQSNTKNEQAKVIIIKEAKPLINQIINLIAGSKNESGKREGGLFNTQGEELIGSGSSILNDMDSLRYMVFTLLIITLVLSIMVSYSLSKISSKITLASQNISTTLSEVKHASNMQSTGVSQQASSINEITASLEEIDKSANQTMEKAKTLGEIAEKTSQKGQLGLNSVSQSIQGMRTIRDKVETIAKAILELSNQTQQVGEITTVVNTLALQSKMLALNASIEAAKAGEAGKGFAVVASEVKNLAEQSEQATAQVQKILEDIRHGTERAVLVTEEGTKGVDEGTGLVEQMGEIVRSLNEAINETMVASQQIEAAVRQESLGIEQITVGMNEIKDVTSSFVNTVKQTNDSVIKLDDMANSIKTYTQGLNKKSTSLYQ